MPYTLPIREAYPVRFEDLPIVGIVRETVLDQGYDWYNNTTKTVLVGEPIQAMGSIGVSKRVILPGKWGRLFFGMLVDFMVDPVMVTQVLAGAPVYFDTALEVAPSYIPGYATGLLPATGFRLGRAVGIVENTTNTVLSGTSPVAQRATPGAGHRIRVLMDPMSTMNELGSAVSLRTRLTIAQVNAGTIIIPAEPGIRYRVQDMAMIAIGGAAATATSVDILGTQATASVKLMDARVAGLTQNTLLRAGTVTNGLILAGGASFMENDVNTPISVNHTGSDVATATHIDVLVSYVRVPA